MTGARKPVFLAGVLFMAAIAGCITGTGHGETGGTSQVGAVTTQFAELAITRPSCSQMAVFLFVPVGQVVDLIPAPFVAADGSRFGPSLQPPPDDAAALLVVATDCGTDTFAWVGILIESGPYEDLAGPADFSFYEIARYTTLAEELAWLAARDFPVVNLPVSVEVVTTPILPTGGTLSVATFGIGADGTEASGETVALLPVRIGQTLVRWWHLNDHGLFASDYRFPVHDVGLGQHPLCTFRNGSPAAEAFGSTDCKDAGGLTEVIPETSADTLLRFWPMRDGAG